MILKRNHGSLPLPYDFGIVMSVVRRQFPERIDFALLEMRVEELLKIRDKNKPSVLGVPMYFAIADGSVVFYPKADASYTIKVRYYPAPKEV